MVRQKIEELLEKYFDGETNIKEEKFLRDYFLQTENIPEEWKEYKALFTYFEIEASQTYERDILLPKKRNYKWPIGISAVAAVIFTIFMLQPPTDPSNAPTEMENSGKAIENARSLFMIMGDAPEEGREKLEYLNELNALKIMKEQKIKESKKADSLENEKDTIIKK